LAKKKGSGPIQQENRATPQVKRIEKTLEDDRNSKSRGGGRKFRIRGYSEEGEGQTLLKGLEGIEWRGKGSRGKKKTLARTTEGGGKKKKGLKEKGGENDLGRKKKFGGGKSKKFHKKTKK